MLVREAKKLNLGVLPVQCPEFCYKRALRDDKQLSWAATLANGSDCDAPRDNSHTSVPVAAAVTTLTPAKVVGALVAEYEPLNKAVHVRTLAVEPRYRRQGIARQLIERLVQQAQLLTQQYGAAIAIDALQLHVHVGNADGIAFYDRMGFREHARLERYYRHLEPPACLVMRYELATPAAPEGVSTSDDIQAEVAETEPL